MVFGDGSSIPTEPLEYALEVANKNGVNLKWRKGDVALLDNYLVMHARRLFEGDRKVYASLVL
jgi:alpha-ketoglutarate-dependent taurine dioxygenase